MQPNPQYYCGVVAAVAWQECPVLNGSVTAFIDVPEVVSASLSVSSSSCLARTGGEVATYCTGAPQTASLTLTMEVRFSDGHMEQLRVPASCVTWSDSAGCASVSETGTDGAFVVRVVGFCASTLVTAWVDGAVNSTSVSVCVETMIGVHMYANFYPGGGAVSGGVVTRIPCTGEWHRVQATAECFTTAGVRSAVASAVGWEISGQSPVSGVQSVVVRMDAASVTVRATINSRAGGLLLTQSSAESSFTIGW